ncbi:ferritin [bacterium]|nr:ferritin [bacterium]
MVLSKKLQAALNDQINKEMASAYLYFSMASWLHDQNLDGMASWMNAQAIEEMGHAKKIYSYVYERGGRVILDAIDKPKSDWKNAVEVFTDTLAHEQLVTKSIHALLDLAIKDNDHAAKVFLNWFIEEQVEEEASVESILDRLKLVGDKGVGLFMMDRHLGERGGH